MGKLAITGGKPVRHKPFTAWPIYTQNREAGIVDHSRWRDLFSGSW